MKSESQFLTQLSLSYPDFHPDPAQTQALAQLADIYQQLTAPQPKLRRFFRSPKSIRGLYLFGKVGRGKTYLMDRFYDLLPFTEKKREHFHEFMNRVHLKLKELQGCSDPLKKLASDLRAQARVICFDEFIVTDIANAMLLGRLMEALFDEGITLIATSNTALDNLYEDGLQRERFLPAITLLKQHLKECSVDNQIDYRLQEKGVLGSYFSPLGMKASQKMQSVFLELTQKNSSHAKHLEFGGRAFECLAYYDGVAWFEFSELCEKPRAASDYFEILKEFHTILLSDLPNLSTLSDNTALRFINLIDVFYDEQVRLIISAAKSIDELYLEGEFRQEFERTKSRLHEMQTASYREKSLSRKYESRARL